MQLYKSMHIFHLLFPHYVYKHLNNIHIFHGENAYCLLLRINVMHIYCYLSPSFCPTKTFSKYK